MVGPNRAVVFVDGSNWYHALEGVRVKSYSTLDYQKVSQKLAGAREWHGLRWYIGQVVQNEDPRSVELYRGQRTFIERLDGQDPKISIHYGRIEVRQRENEAASELRAYLGDLKVKLPPQVFRDLQQLAKKHSKSRQYVEKAVDVMLAVDMVAMAINDEYDTAYLLSRDGDFTHAVTTIQGLGKKVFAASTDSAFQLSQVCTFIRLKTDWFDDCHLPFETHASSHPPRPGSVRPRGSNGAFGKGKPSRY